MWSAKISFDAGQGNVAGNYARSRGVSILIFPLSWSYEKEGIIVNYSGMVFGEESKKKGFFRDWKGDKKKRGYFRGFKRPKEGILRDLEVNGDFFIGKVWESDVAPEVYNKNLIYSRPWMIDKNGIQTIVVNAFEKKYIENFIGACERFNPTRVHYVRREKVGNIAFRLMAPDLTERQKWAMDLAVSRGYYEIPRKVSVQDLAEIGKVSFATFHGHLRKAERKIMPFWFGG